MAISLSLNEIKKDVEELVAIINESHISKIKVNDVLWYCRLSNDKSKRLSYVKEAMEEESIVAFVTGLDDCKLSDRFIYKMTYLISRYETKELNMLLKCTSLVLDDMDSKNPLNAKVGK